jgi:3-oxoacyl-[acyl-carrier protein] reductase
MKRLVLITGGTSGIGLGAAKSLGPTHEFALVYAGNHEKAEAARKELEALDIAAKCYAAPLKNYEDCKALFTDVTKDFGRSPDILVNSHGRIQDGLFMGSDFRNHVAIIEELLIVTMGLCQLAMKPMYGARWGRIINLSSISAFYAKRGQANYAAAKAGIVGFSKTLALEVAHRGVTVNVISPGLIETPMTEGILSKFQATDASELKRRVPAGYAGAPSDVGALVKFLASEEARYITGANFVIDGGRSLGDSGS